MKHGYSARLQWSEEDGGWVATVPELEGVSAFGETLAEALGEIGVAREVWLEEVEARGGVAPDPQWLPDYSGQFRLRIPRSLHAWLVERADVDGVSLNTLVVQLLAEARGADAAAPTPRVSPSSAAGNPKARSARRSRSR